MPELFTYPFSYAPLPEISKAASELITAIRDGGMACPEEVRTAFLREGKMLGVLKVNGGFLYAFSGLAGGHAVVDGFVPPVFDLTPADSYFKRREREISSMSPGPAKARASADLQRWLSEQYVVMNGLGQTSSVLDIFARRGLVPPGGTGDCSAPKLLNHAFRLGLKPLAMGEFWIGPSPAREVREEGRFYPSCMGKCGPLLTWMLQGVDVEPNPLDSRFSISSIPAVVWSDKDIIVVEKPAGMLSVPGKTGGVSLLEWLQSAFGEVHSCHRLDMDTSGLMVFARNLRSKTNLEEQFASREIRKTYRARLVGGPWNHARKGTIALPLSADLLDRPRQIVDPENGKKAITEYEVLDFLPDGEVEVAFRPFTGRSHQLRVLSAHTLGLGHPIKGDRLYGSADGDRLWLHADSLEFHHPTTGDIVSFNSSETQ